MPDADANQPPGQESAHDATIDRATDWLRSRRVVAFPTETVYGLGANALDERAVALVFGLKQRPSNNPLIVHVSGIAMARGLCRAWPDEAELLADQFWPGPLTLVLPRDPIVPAIVSAGGPTIAIRVPNHPIALALIERFGGPIVGPSANPSGMVSPTTAQHVQQAFAHDERVMILDGGPCDAGIESTVLTLAESPPRILRSGIITAGQLAEALGSEVVGPSHGQGDPSVRGSEDRLESPGMLAKHYAPRTMARLVESDGSNERWADAAAGAERVAVLGSSRVIETARLALGDRLTHAEPMPEQALAYARRLYAALRLADDVNAEIILIEMPSERNDLWQAIHDRLSRATAPADA